MPSSRHTGFYKTAAGELQILVDGEEKLAVDGTGVSFFGSAPVAQAAHIGNPTGGETTDAEARAAINSILVVLENLGFTATS